LEELISPKELSKLLKVSKPYPYLLAKRGLIPYYKIGDTIRFKSSDVEAFLERSRVGRRGVG
jgi:excisionase family DNA binding protein